MKTVLDINQIFEIADRIEGKQWQHFMEMLQRTNLRFIRLRLGPCQKGCEMCQELLNNFSVNNGHH